MTTEYVEVNDVKKENIKFFNRMLTDLETRVVLVLRLRESPISVLSCRNMIIIRYYGEMKQGGLVKVAAETSKEMESVIKKAGYGKSIPNYSAVLHSLENLFNLGIVAKRHASFKGSDVLWFLNPDADKIAESIIARFMPGE